MVMKRVDTDQVRTHELQERLKRSQDVVRWLHAVSTLSDGCCRLVCEMLDVPTLVALMEVRETPPAFGLAISRGRSRLFFGS